MSCGEPISIVVDDDECSEWCAESTRVGIAQCAHWPTFIGHSSSTLMNVLMNMSVVRYTSERHLVSVSSKHTTALS